MVVTNEYSIVGGGSRIESQIKLLGMYQEMLSEALIAKDWTGMSTTLHEIKHLISTMQNGTYKILLNHE